RDITRLGICRSFQVPQLYGSLSVRENMLVALGIVLRNARLGGFFSRVSPKVPGYEAPAEEVAERILERFGLTPYRERNAQVLPGGVRKLLDIALTMAAKPRVLLLDEPTSGVSAEEKFGIMEMVMKAVKAEGATVLFVEHDMEVVSRFAQRVLAFYDGRIIADAAPEAALNHPEVRRYVVGALHA
ncbi:MAG: ATP-binding cassette domain-containing protein, partial [Burkholderiales bacterium]